MTNEINTYYRLAEGREVSKEESLISTLASLPGARGVTVKRKRVDDPDPREARTEFYAVVQGIPGVVLEVGYGSAYVDTQATSTPLANVLSVHLEGALDVEVVSKCLGSLGYYRWE